MSDIPQWLIKRKENLPGLMIQEDGWEVVASQFDTVDEACNFLECTETTVAKRIHSYDLDVDWDITDESEFNRHRDTVETETKFTGSVGNEVGSTIRSSEFEKYKCETGVYVLECEDEKWYVGCSSRLDERLRQHFSGRGSLWTQRHHPIEIVSVETYDDIEWDDLLKREDEKTIEIMQEKGWEDVRGGKWWSPYTSHHPPYKSLKGSTHTSSR